MIVCTITPPPDCLARLAWLVLLDHMIPRAGLALAHLEKA